MILSTSNLNGLETLQLFSQVQQKALEAALLITRA